MPPKGKTKGAPAQKAQKAIEAAPAQPASRDLIAVAPKHVGHARYAVKRDESGKRPTTSRALVLRNGKHGAMGAGELQLFGKLSGREKLDLLAEDLTEHYKKALAAPFRSTTCFKIADSQFNARLDDIISLKDAAFFYDRIRDEATARTVPRLVKGKVRSPIADADRVALVVGTSIHNAYMLASVWKIVRDLLHEIDAAGHTDSKIKAKLASDPELRERYLILYDIVNELVQAAHTYFQVLVTTTKHYVDYFKVVQGSDPASPDFQFQFERLKDAYKSFLDSIVLELCLPHSAYPKRVLLQILNESVDEAPREARRFPQAMWDAVGDLSVAVRLQELVEGPLLGPEGEAWRKQPREMPEAYNAWTDAQLFSAQAVQNIEPWMNIISPLERARKQEVLNQMWRKLEENYEAASGRGIDELWNVEGEFQRVARWSPYRPTFDLSDSESEGPAGPGAVRKRGKRDGQGRLAITEGGEDESSDGSMPPLMDVSDSSEMDEDFEDEEEEESEYEDDGADDEEDDEYDYDSDDEENLRHLLHDAMDAANTVPGIYDARNEAVDMEGLPEEAKNNPFLKLLGSLRGRMFSGSSKLKTTKQDAPRGGFAVPPRKPTVPAGGPAPAGGAPSAGGGAPDGSRKATVEDVEDEEEKAARKKKKKKPKKKKAGGAGGGDGADDEAVLEPIEEDRPATPPPGAPVPEEGSPAAGQAAAAKKKKKKKTGGGGGGGGPPAAGRASLDSQTSPQLPGMSTTSLPFTAEQSAQSARSYLAQSGLADKKEKVKTRGADGDDGGAKQGGFFSRFARREEPRAEDAEETRARKNWFRRLGKKTTLLMHQLLATPEDEKKGGRTSMKWENFVKIMKDMGFTYNPSTAGSSVRFDHPNARSITFHKPHPDPTIDHIHMKIFSKKLKEYYGWSEEDFYAKAD